MSRHLRLPHPHVADRFIEHLAEGFFAGIHRTRWHAPPARTVPAAQDWESYPWPAHPDEELQ